VSGDQAWNGTTLILKPKPATSMRRPRLSVAGTWSIVAIDWLIAAKRVLAVAPKTRAMP